jgi:hypothetical protein
LIGGWERAVRASLLGLPGRPLQQLNIIGGVRIKAKMFDVSAFERLGRGSKAHLVARRRQFDELNEFWLALASSDYLLDGPRVELDERCVENEVRDQGKREQFIEAWIAPGARADRLQEAARSGLVVDVIV